MAGVKGAGGPVPKRENQRRRTNSKKPTTAAAGAVVDDAPKANSRWHPVAKRWFNSLAKSGQSRFYEESDWAVAYLIGESISRELKPQPVVVKGPNGEGFVEMVSMSPKAASVAAWLKGMTALLATEGDRRRAQLELEGHSGPDEEGGDVSHLDDARARLRGAS